MSVVDTRKTNLDIPLLDLAHNEIVHAKVGEGGMKTFSDGNATTRIGRDLLFCEHIQYRTQTRSV